MNRFDVGDKVRVVDFSAYGSSLSPDKVYTITEVEQSDDGYYFYTIDGRSEYWFEHRFVLYDELSDIREIDETDICNLIIGK